MSTLTINLNEEYKIKIENGNEFHESIFSEIYINAAKNIVEIIDQSVHDGIYDGYNNIIAFTGERGKGKSSSMISFRDALININEKVHLDFFEAKKLEDESLNKTFETLRKNTFAEIDIIDPSLFRGNESLFEIILAKMFSKFQEEIKKSDRKISDEVRRNLIKHFQNVFQNLQIINSDRKDLYKQETIEALSRLATSSNLRDCFNKLVCYYLKEFEDKNFLVIAIDDFDLNISGAYEMLEDIRQFLIQNKIIILIACKIEQLADSIRLSIVKEYEKLLKNEVKEIDRFYLADSPNEKATKYIDKILPLKRRLFLPDMVITNKLGFKICKDNSCQKYDSIESGLLELVFLNSKIFIPKVKEDSNVFIPKTLRELTNFISFVNSIKDYKNFLSYILNRKTDYLSYSDISILDNMNPQPEYVNKFFFNWLYSKNEFKPYNLEHRNYLSRDYNSITIGEIYTFFERFKNVTLLTDGKSIYAYYYINLLFVIYNKIKFENKLTRETLYLNELFLSSDTIFPRDKEKNLPRDRFSFSDLSFLNKATFDVKFFIICFVPLFGNDYNYLRKVDPDDLTNGECIFNSLSFINVLINPQYNLNRFKKTKIESELYIQLQNWSCEGIELFSNVFFLNILFSKLKNLISFSNSLSYSKNLFKFLTTDFVKCLKEIQDEYSYLQLEIEKFESNPLFLFWANNQDEINSIFDIIFSNSGNKIKYTDEEIKIAKYLLNRYQRYFSPDGDFSTRGAKQAMNSVIKYFQQDSIIYQTLQELRDLMDQDIEEGLTLIEKYLKSIK